MTMKPEQFPILRAAARSQERFDLAITQIATALAAGEIRNVTLSEAKNTFSRAAEAAWEASVSGPYFHAGRWADQPEAVQELDRKILITSLHDIIATSKKLVKTTAHGEAVDAMRRVSSEALPLAEAVASLKTKIVKGRERRETPVPSNPSKIVKTCPCCFRAIAVVGGTMAHHGYERPGYGAQTASCAGIRFKPLEVSNEGLVWLIGVERKALEKNKTILGNVDQITELDVFRKKNLVKVTPSDVQWKQTLRSHIFKLESEVRQIESNLRVLVPQLENWKPEGGAA